MIFPSASTIIPSAFTFPITLPLASRTKPSSPIVPKTCPSGAIACLNCLPPELLISTQFSPVVASQTLQSSGLTETPETSTSSCLALLAETFVSCHIILKLFCTFAAIVGCQLIVTLHVSLPSNSLPSQLVSYLKPSNGASSNSTDIILIAFLPFVPTVKTLLAVLPNITCPILMGLGISVIGRSISSESLNSISVSSELSLSISNFVSSAIFRSISNVCCSCSSPEPSNSKPKKKTNRVIIPTIKIIRFVLRTYLSECVNGSLLIYLLHPHNTTKYSITT